MYIVNILHKWCLKSYYIYIYSPFTHPQVVPNQYELNTDDDILKNVGNHIFASPHWLPYYGQWRPETVFTRINLLLCSTNITSGMEQLEGDFHWVNYPFIVLIPRQLMWRQLTRKVTSELKRVVTLWRIVSLWNNANVMNQECAFQQCSYLETKNVLYLKVLPGWKGKAGDGGLLNPPTTRQERVSNEGRRFETRV